MGDDPPTQERADAEALLAAIGFDEPCGENDCHCYCAGKDRHVCGCDCPPRSSN